MNNLINSIEQLLEALDETDFTCRVTTQINSAREALNNFKKSEELKSELEKDAARLLFALHDAWPSVRKSCTINSVKDNITGLIRKHGDFADFWDEQNKILSDSIRNDKDYSKLNASDSSTWIPELVDEIARLQALINQKTD